MGERQTCPRCGAECVRDEVDIGIGVMCGPWGCGDCGWSEYPEYDRSNPDRQPGLDERGGLTPVQSPATTK